MTEDERTIWCGNLSEKVTEDVLYELFIQGGPIQKLNIPKDREGKQRTFAFITYKHAVSVQYAISLFDGTLLYNRAISLKSRNNEQQPEMNHAEQNFHHNDLIQLGKQMLQFMPSNQGLLYSPHAHPPALMMQNPYMPPQFSYNDDRRSYQAHPYQREPERHNNRYNNDYGRDNRRDYHSSHRDKHRDNSHRSNRHESNKRHDRRYRS